jgi:DNA-binding GntR family transcriptional regulator
VPLLRDEAHARLEQAIMDGELAPGQQLRPDELAGALGLSRMPVREALARLADAGLVETRPRSGTRVSPLRLDDTSQALAVITAMHELAVHEAVPSLEPAHIERLEKAGRRFAEAVSRGDHEQAIAADDEFHGLFIEVAANRPLSETVMRYMPILRRAEALRFGSLPGRRSIAAHAQILAAARTGNTVAAVHATRANWDSLAAQIQQSMDEDQQEGRDES